MRFFIGLYFTLINVHTFLFKFRENIYKKYNYIASDIENEIYSISLTLFILSVLSIGYSHNNDFILGIIFQLSLMVTVVTFEIPFLKDGYITTKTVIQKNFLGKS
ncbi:MAG: hypothetical protein A2252_02935 [Elusimicrobia bacterium RIFOXYA2_FULL_39_19]|nr:MAG: hypothetical protein A2252_02935 [Elusimicrobia bacterium RIFOXYA2_FULL_39_19]